VRNVRQLRVVEAFKRTRTMMTAINIGALSPTLAGRRSHFPLLSGEEQLRESLEQEERGEEEQFSAF